MFSQRELKLIKEGLELLVNQKSSDQAKELFTNLLLMGAPEDQKESLMEDMMGDQSSSSTKDDVYVLITKVIQIMNEPSMYNRFNR